jgi:hypothetical protein
MLPVGKAENDEAEDVGHPDVSQQSCAGDLPVLFAGLRLILLLELLRVPGNGNIFLAFSESQRCSWAVTAGI